MQCVRVLFYVTQLKALMNPTAIESPLKKRRGVVHNEICFKAQHFDLRGLPYTHLKFNFPKRSSWKLPYAGKKKKRPSHFSPSSGLWSLTPSLWHTSLYFYVWLMLARGRSEYTWMILKDSPWPKYARRGEGNGITRRGKEIDKPTWLTSHFLPIIFYFQATVYYNRSPCSTFFLE